MLFRSVGGSLDEIEARNRAEIEARLGHPAPTGSVTIYDVISMSRAGVSEDVIVNHIHNHGAAAPLRAADLILLKQQGVSPRVVQALQAPPPAAAYPPPQPVYVGPPYYGPPGPYWGPPPYPYYYRPSPSFGFVIRGH